MLPCARRTHHNSPVAVVVVFAGPSGSQVQTLRRQPVRQGDRRRRGEWHLEKCFHAVIHEFDIHLKATPCWLDMYTHEFSMTVD